MVLSLKSGSDEPNAAIFSHDDLDVINGGGALTVNARYHAGIVSKIDLKITEDAHRERLQRRDQVAGGDSLVIKDGVGCWAVAPVGAAGRPTWRLVRLRAFLSPTQCSTTKSVRIG